MSTEMNASSGLRVTQSLPQGVYLPDGYELWAFFGYSGEASVCGAKYTLSPGSLLLLSPGDICYCPQGGEGDLIRFLFLPTQIYGDPEPWLIAYRGTKQFLPRNMGEELRLQLQRLSALLGKEDRIPLARMMLSEALLYLGACQIPEREGEGLRRCVAYMRDNSHRELSLDELATVAGLSKFHFCRIFRREAGITPHAYLGYLRAIEARAQLSFGVSPKEVSRMLGYQDYSTFFRTYKKVFGTAPVRHREEETRSE